MSIQASWSKGNKLNRLTFYEHHLRDKTILDIGCVVGSSKPDWVHGHIRGLTKDIVGIDIDAAGIRRIKEKNGVEIMHANAQAFDLGKTFQVVHAAELIEHLDNASGFLQSVRKHMGPESVLILTTPNAYRIANVVYNFMGRLKVNHEHTCWYCEFTLTTLLKRFGFDTFEIDYIPHQSYSWSRRALSRLLRVFLPKKLAWNTLYVAARLKRTDSGDGA